MPFRIPKPTYDAALVADIELHLNQYENTEAVTLGLPYDGLQTIYVAAGERDPASIYVRPMIQILDVITLYPSSPWRGHGCGSCDNWAYTARCELHNAGEGPMPLQRPAPANGEEERARQAAYVEAGEQFRAAMGLPPLVPREDRPGLTYSTLPVWTQNSDITYTIEIADEQPSCTYQDVVDAIETLGTQGTCSDFR